MDIRAEATLQRPRDDVYLVNQDRLAELVPYLPNVRRIEVLDRKEANGRIELVNVWHGGGELPAAVRKFLSEGMLSWTDYASWDPSTWSCDWRSESHSFREAVDSRGHNDFADLGPGRAAIRIRGRIVVDATKVHGVPRILAGTIGKAIEAFLAKQIQDNLEEIARGVERYLGEHPLPRS